MTRLCHGRIRYVSTNDIRVKSSHFGTHFGLRFTRTNASAFDVSVWKIAQSGIEGN